ncbi:homoserine O-acetyltransferase MetX [Stratiformator vulcanicus]|uniref:Homoserine O-acetyltransferase n=1 Tax=Stratiformator vulcanicus TaxID=2527980 RepID=A0A517QWA5_9PLAN|nr:homoserine O-acetyltransferase [Stratiformator vulcanicus]QDT35850.1 Homoserine O-acetyltransferase [Stratiformator vulcanicus]
MATDQTTADIETQDGPPAAPASGAEVGLVETRHITLFENEPLKTASGDRIGPITVAYETYGELSPERDNAVFLCHALTGDAHAAGRHSLDEKKAGWWHRFVGPGRGIDTDQYYVICANVFGGCQGTTGPGSINPATDEPWGLSFPFLTIGDMVTVHAELVRSLGVDKLLSIVGGSLGGMQLLEWAARYPDMLESGVVLASAAKLAAQGIAFNTVGRRAILADPKFNSGNYYGGEKPQYGLALARMIAHITYLSESSIEQKFGRRLQHSDHFAYDLTKETEFQVESYLHYQGKRFVERFDANSYLYLTRAMDYFDLAHDYGSLTDAFRKTSARFLVASFTTDWLFPTSQSRDLVRALLKAGRDVTFLEFDSPYGHDAFLIPKELPKLASTVGPFLERTLSSVRKTSGRQGQAPVANSI